VVPEQRAAAGRATRYLPLLAVILAGCGSSGPASGASSDSVAGVQQAGQRLLTDLQAGHYSEACEAFTATARASFAGGPGGCASALPSLYGALHGELDRWASQVLPTIQVEGDTALFDDNVQARFEQGRWRFETDVW
jgi:hypothetical protein